MQYKVPQHIDEEDKILGPLTFVNFIYLLVGGALILFSFVLFDFALFIFLAIPIAFFSLAFALIKVQDQPFSHFFVSFLLFLKQPKKRIWHDLEEEEDRAANQYFNILAERETKTTKQQGAAVASPATQPTSPVKAAPPAVPAPPRVYPSKPARKVAVTLVTKGGA